MSEKWIAKEVELAQRHEELLLRREALLQGSESYYDAQANRAASFIASFPLAEQRNKELLRDLRECLQDLKRDATEPGTPKFNTLTNNYWMMVKNIYPVWQEELGEYQKRHGGSPYLPHPPQGTPPRSQSPRPPRSPASPGSPQRSPRTTHRSPRRPTSPGRTPSPNGRPPSPPGGKPAKRSQGKPKSNPSKSKTNSRGHKS